MTSKQLKDIAAQIERTVNSRHSSVPEMHITTETRISNHIAWVDIFPVHIEGRFDETIYFAEEILPFAAVYGFSVHFGVEHNDDGKAVPCITFFYHDTQEG